MSDTVLICTDLDRTLLPNGPQPESAGARPAFARLVAREDVRLAYVTGRHLALADQAIANYRLPQPDFLVADVGTSVYRCDGARRSALDEWREDIGRDWGGHDHGALVDLFRPERHLRLQEHARQSRYKLSYYLPLHVDRQRLLERLGKRLAAHDIRASLVFSIDEPAGVGLLDVVPARATKLHAVEFLMRRLTIGPRHCLFAGDSGNDLPALVSAVPAVLVANASASVRAAAVQGAMAGGHVDCLYLAEGGFLGMNGNYAAGILEGAAHFMPWLFDASSLATLDAVPGPGAGS